MNVNKESAMINTSWYHGAEARFGHCTIMIIKVKYLMVLRVSWIMTKTRICMTVHVWFCHTFDKTNEVCSQQMRRSNYIYTDTDVFCRCYQVGIAIHDSLYTHACHEHAFHARDERVLSTIKRPCKGKQVFLEHRVTDLVYPDWKSMSECER